MQIFKTRATKNFKYIKLENIITVFNEFNMHMQKM